MFPMTTRRITCATFLLLTLTTFNRAFAVAEEASVRLEGVPAALILPFPQGANRVLTATIQGADVRAVWLAADSDAKGRVVLTRSGDGEWQVNLADPLVYAVLSADAEKGDGAGGQFHVFAQTAGG